MADLEIETVTWCREMLQPLATGAAHAEGRMNAADDGLAGIQQLAGDATLLFYLTEEAQEGRNAYVEGRSPDFSSSRKRP